APDEASSGAPAGHGLDLEVLLEPEPAPLAAVARLLVAAERRGPLVGSAVEVDIAGADAARDPPRALDVTRGHVARQAIGRVVGDAHGLLLVLVADDGQHRPEDLLTRDRHV